MALTGTYLRNVDDKGRIAFPKRLRDDFSEPAMDCLFVAPGTERSLFVYGPQAFQNLANRLAQRSGHQDFLRLFYSSAERLDLDGQSRIRLSDRLAAHAGLSKEVYLLGVQDHAEIWDKATWEEFSARTIPTFDQLAREAFQTL